jgi:hypothetical protein
MGQVVWKSAVILIHARTRAQEAMSEEAEDDSQQDAKVLRRDPNAVSAAEMEYLARLGVCAIANEASAGAKLNCFLAHLQLVAIAAVAAADLGWGAAKMQNTSPPEILDRLMPEMTDPTDEEEMKLNRHACACYAKRCITPEVTGDFVTFVQMVIQQRTSLVRTSSASLEESGFSGSSAASACVRGSSTSMDCDSREHQMRFYVLKKDLKGDRMLKLYLPSLWFASDFIDYPQTLVGEAKSDFDKALHELTSADGATGSEESNSESLVPGVDQLTALKRRMYDRSAIVDEPGNIYWWRSCARAV